MATYYCDSSAGVDGSGTIGSPFNNANNHVGDLVAGDTMYLRGSTNPATPRVYSGQILIAASNGCESGTSGSRITLANYPGEYVLIQATSAAHGISITGLNYWTISGTNTSYGIEIDQNGNSNACVNIDGSDFITLEYLETHNCSYDMIIRVRDSDDCTIQYCYIYDNDILAGTDHSGIMAYPVNSPTSGADSYRLTVRYCTITECAGDCIVIERQSGVNNYFRDVVIEYNDLSAHSTAAASEQGVDLKSAYGATVRYNTFHGFRYCDGSVGSTGAGTGSGCLAVAIISENADIYGNTFYDYSCNGVYVNRSNVNIYQNLFYGAVFQSSPVPSYIHNHIYLTHTSGTSTVNVIKNTFVGRHTSSGTCITIDVTGTLTVNYRDNCHSATGTLNNTGATLNYSYNGWFASPAATWSGTGDVTGSDAGFNNPGSNDYRLTASSACLNAGTAVSPYTDGYYGAAPDLGYYEYGSAVSIAYGSFPAAGQVGNNLNTFTVTATRYDGTTDTAYTTSTALTIATGTGSLSGTTSKAMTSGVATFSDIQLSAVGAFTLLATSGSFTATSSTVTISAAAVAAESGGASTAASPNAYTGQYNGAAEYEIELLTAAGTRIAYLTKVSQFGYTKGISSEGTFSITLNPDFDFRVVTRHQQIRIHRQPPGGVMALDFAGLITGWDVRHTDAGYVRTINGPGLGWLLSGRVAAYYAGHASADMSDQAGDMILEIVRDNLGADATTANGREASGVISSTLFSVQAAGSYGPAVEKKFSFNNVADVIKELMDAARQAGTSVYWNVGLAAGVVTVTVSTGQPGQDRTSGAQAVTFGPEFGNFANGKYAYDARDEINRAYALGQGDGSARNIESSEDTTRSGYSPWAIREAAVEDTQVTTTNGLVDKADAVVMAGRPRQTLTGELVSTPRTQYGRDWGLGDLVNVAFDGAQYSALVRVVSVAVPESGAEKITGAIEIVE